MENNLQWQYKQYQKRYGDRYIIYLCKFFSFLSMIIQFPTEFRNPSLKILSVRLHRKERKRKLINQSRCICLAMSL